MNPVFAPLITARLFGSTRAFPAALAFSG